MESPSNPIDEIQLLEIGSDLDHSSTRQLPNILIIDDDVDYIDMVKLILRKAGFNVSGANTFQEAIQKCQEVNPDLILLDLLMPEMDGWDTYRNLKTVTQAPVIFVSAAPMKENVVKGLEIGAEDFIAKPFNNLELVARVKRVLRSVPSTSRSQRRVFLEGGYQIDPAAHELTRNGKQVHLLPREFSLLEILVENAPHNVPYEKITTRIWGLDSTKNRAHLKTIAFSLKRKLQDDHSSPTMIANNRGIGYQLILRPEDGHSLGVEQ